MPRLLRSLALVAAGAAGALLVDPRSGAQRRRHLRELWQQTAALAPGGADAADLARADGGPVEVVEAPTSATAGDPVAGSARVWRRVTPRTVAPGTDTATGTDPGAKYRGPGYEDVSFGQATARDADLVERLVEESGGDLDDAARRFREEAVGSEVLPPGR